MENLRHAQHHALLAKIKLHVVGGAAVADGLALPSRHIIDRLSWFITLDSALPGIREQEHANHSRWCRLALLDAALLTRASSEPSVLLDPTSPAIAAPGPDQTTGRRSTPP